MKSALQVRYVMSPAPFTIALDQTLALAREKMREHDIRHLPVQDGGRLVGVISDRDIFFALGVDKLDASTLKVKDACTSDIYVVGLEEDLAEVSLYMSKNHIGCAVVAEGEQTVGIFTTVDACRVLYEILSGSLNQDS